MGYRKNVYRTLALITQFGISMLAPILLCVFVAVFLEEYARLPVFVPLFFLGAAAGFRNCWKLAKGTFGDEEGEK